MPLDASTLQIVLAALAPGGIAGLAVKLVLNGTKENVKEIKKDVKETKQAVSVLHIRVDALELEQAREQGRQTGLAEALRAREIERESSHP